MRRALGAEEDAIIEVDAPLGHVNSWWGSQLLPVHGVHVVGFRGPVQLYPRDQDGREVGAVGRLEKV